MSLGAEPVRSRQIEFLPWDTGHFGLRVGRLTVSCSDFASVESQLKSARDEGYELLYLIGPSEFILPRRLAQEYRASLADRKTIYRARLHPSQRQLRHGVTLEEYPEGPASPDLIELGTIAGRFSRFFADPRVPRTQAEQLYATWVDKSARRVLADCVLVAKVFESPTRLAGMITLSVGEALGRIQLLAVCEDYRGRGVGKALVLGAHDWMLSRRVEVAEVVTQAANIAANRLYTRCGYAISDVRNVYHCWLAK